MTDQPLKAYDVWDKPTRWFHWINVLAVLGLIGLGLVLFNGKALGISKEGAFLLKKAHIWVGYVFVINLLIRLIWGFFGNRYTRWGGILPGGFGYFSAFRDYVSSLSGQSPKRYLGHNPIGRIGIAVILVLLATQAVTGLVLAGTDIFYPPFGSWIAGWIAAEGVDPATLVPYASEMYDEQAFEDMRDFRKPFIMTHIYAFYALVVMIVVHVAAVIMTEIREGGSLISALFTGRKILPGTPVDLKQPNDPEQVRRAANEK